MSDNSISIVPRVSHFIDNHIKAQEILAWLVSQKAVESILSDCVLSSSLGYAIGKGASSISNGPHSLPFNLAVNGLEIITERTVFDTGGNGIDEIICPNCSENFVTDTWDLEPWANGKSEKLGCPKCGMESEIQQFSFKPAWGFSNLGFRFWNWPSFKPEFIKEFEQKLGYKVQVVEQHI